MFFNNKENKLIKRAIAGDEKAFSTLLESYYGTIYAIAYKWLGNKEDAQDIAQDVCIKLGKSLPHFRMESKFSTWLYRITLNMVYDFQRKKQKYHLFDTACQTKDEQSPAPYEHIEAQKLWQYVNKLPDKQKNAVLLIYAQELSHKEAALTMECKESTISWYIFEAKKQLKLMVNNDEKI